MYIRSFNLLGKSQLIDLALRLPEAHFFSGWNSLEVVSNWQTLALNELNEGPNTFESIAATLIKRPTASINGSGQQHPPFTTGICCHFTYEAAALLESSLQLSASSDQVPVLSFGVYDATVSTHLPSGKTYIYATSKAAADQLEAFLVEELSKVPSKADSERLGNNVKSDVTQDVFQNQVESIRQRILEGDFYQANLTRMLSVDLGLTSRPQLAGFAERFLTQSEAPFGAILNFPNATVISASPERFFRIEPSTDGRKIFAEPIKGTRPRHEDLELDKALKEDLLKSEKDRAENIMIADLVRNDLSRVCTDESIVADPVCELRSFKNVHHLVTRISGMLREDVSNLDALLAQFPCGSITGAPKWAAMDAIAELEQRGRGIYCGAIGYFDDRGHADFSVAIRTAVASFDENGTTLTYGTGGGITILSDPEEEFTETEDKASGFLRALQL